MYKDKIKQLREDKKINQKVLAKLLDIGIKAYSMYETETEIIPIKHLIALCNYFDVSIDYIFDFTNQPQYPNSIKAIDKKISGTRLKEFRKSNKITQTELGEVLKCSYGTIAGYERGRYLIATPFLYDICKNYKISADYLLGKIDNPKYFE